MDDSVTVPIDLAQIPNEMIGEAFHEKALMVSIWVLFTLGILWEPASFYSFLLLKEFAYAP